MPIDDAITSTRKRRFRSMCLIACLRASFWPPARALSSKLVSSFSVIEAPLTP